jgi:WD40 repeat protein
MRFTQIAFFLLITASISLAQQPRLVLPVGHTKTVNVAVFSANGKLVATASDDGSTKIWDAKTGLLITDLRDHPSTVEFVTFNHKSDKLVTTSGDKTGRIWNLQTGSLMATLKGHTRFVRTAIFSHDDKKIVTASTDPVAKIWDANTGKLLLDLKGHTDQVNAAVFSPDDKVVMTASDDGSAGLWNAANGVIIATLHGHTDEVYSAAFSHHGKWVATASADGTARIWDAANGKSIMVLTGHQAKVYSANFSNDDRFLITASADKSVKIWNTQTGALLSSFNDFQADVVLAVYSPDNNFIISTSADYTVHVRNAQTGALLAKHNNNYTAMNLHGSYTSPDSRYLVTMGTDNNCTVWDLRSNTPFATLRSRSLKMMSGVFTAAGNRLVSVAADSTSSIWDMDKIGLINHLEKVADGSGAARPVTTDNSQTLPATITSTWDAHIAALAMSQMGSALNEKFEPGISADGKYIATFGISNTVNIFDAKTGKILHVLTGHTDRILTVLFSPDSKLLITTSIDQTAKLWEASTGKLLHDFNGHESQVNSALFSTDGKKIVTASHDETARVWDTETGALLALINEKTASMEFAMFSASGNKVLNISRHDTAKLWNAETGQLLASLKGHSGNITFGMFSPDGKRIVTASSDHTAKVWNTEDGTLLFTLSGHQSDVTFACFSPDGTKIISSSFDKTIKTWDAITGKLLQTSLEENNSYYTSISFSRNRILTTRNSEAIFMDLKSGLTSFSLYPIGAEDWLALIPAGYYMCTQNAAKQIHFVKGLQVITFEQLDVKYNRPDKVLEATGCTDSALIRSYRRAYEKRISKLALDTSSFVANLNVPDFNIVDADGIPFDQSKPALTLHLKGMDSSFLLDRFNVWVNDVPIYGMKGISLKQKKSRELDTTITITLSQGTNRIEAALLNTNGTESFKTPLFVKHTPPQPVQNKIHFIGIGINQFANASYNLTWSVKDIRDLASKLKEHYGEALTVDTLFDENVTRENVMALKQQLLALGEDDKVIVSFSGHGVLSTDLDYFLSTYNISFEQPSEFGLPYEELEGLLNDIRPRQKLMLIDACHSGEVDKDEIARIEKSRQMLDSAGVSSRSRIKVVPKAALGMASSFELMQNLFVTVGRSTGTTIISAAGGMQYAQERGDLKNGVFTFSILDAFNNNASLTVSALKKIVSEKVSTLTNGLQKPTSRNETINIDWQVW